MTATFPAAVILLVDDDQIGVQTRTAVLECNGYHVLTAHTAEQGFRIFREQHVDLVMADHFLSDKRGTSARQDNCHNIRHLRSLTGSWWDRFSWEG